MILGYFCESHRNKAGTPIAAAKNQALNLQVQDNNDHRVQKNWLKQISAGVLILRLKSDIHVLGYCLLHAIILGMKDRDGKW